VLARASTAVLETDFTDTPPEFAPVYEELDQYLAIYYVVS
jgi:hypothetical protein